MKANGRQVAAFQHPGEATVERSMDRSKQLRSEALGEGISRFVGFIRSFDAKDKTAGTDSRRAQEAALTALL